MTFALPLLATFGVAACTSPGADDDGNDDFASAEDTTTTADDEADDDDDDDSASECGDGTVDPDEQCDLGAGNGDDQSCTSQCTIAACGDGMLYTGFEACDDGNTSNLDECVGGCEIAHCGDGFLQTGVEACDDGNTDDTDGCTQSCMPSTCGDGVVQDGEQCDDGNSETSDMCPACQFAFCGDGFVQAGEEVCDDGNEIDSDACLPVFCQPAACGDGVIQVGVEECDDGNTEAKDECTDTCAVAFCGDGIKHVGSEECDDGNDVDDDFCTTQCISLLYWMEGPQLDVPVDDLGGWEECFSDTFADYSVGLTNTILDQQCTGSKLLIGCKQSGAATFQLLAMGDREDVIFDVGDGEFATHEANGVAWYYSTQWSWGFALGGDPVERNSCDVAQGNPQYRMCWHTSSDALDGGYRCGANDGLWDFNWERVIMHAD
jgi:cysteine-rich repeat protein